MSAATSRRLHHGRSVSRPSTRLGRRRELAVEALEGRLLLSGTQVNNFSLPTGVQIEDMAPGPDGNMWFLAQVTSSANVASFEIGSVTPDGSTITTTPLPVGLVPTDSESPTYGYNRILTTGSDGNLWFIANHAGPVQDGNSTRVTVLEAFHPASQAFTSFLPGDVPEHLTSDPRPDGDLWFSGSSPDGNEVIGYVNPTSFIGSGEDVDIAGHTPIETINGLTVDPAGVVWFSAVTRDNDGVRQGVIGHLVRDAEADTITEFALSPANMASSEFIPHYLVSGPDGNLWFTEENYDTNKFSGRVGSIDASGNLVQLIDIPATTAEFGIAYGIAAGRDSSLWITTGNLSNDGVNFYRVGINGSVSPESIPGPNYLDYHNLYTGPDGNLWFSQNNGQVPPSLANNKISQLIVPPQQYGSYVAANNFGPEDNGWSAQPGLPFSNLPPGNELPIPEPGGGHGSLVYSRKETSLDPTEDAVFEGTFRLDADASGHPKLGASDRIVLGIADGSHQMELEVVRGSGGIVVQMTDAHGHVISTPLSNPTLSHTFRLIKHQDQTVELQLRDASGKFNSIGVLQQAALPVDPKSAASPGFYFGVTAGSSAIQTGSEWTKVRYAVGTTDPDPAALLAPLGTIKVSARRNGAAIQSAVMTLDPRTGVLVADAAALLQVGPGDDLIIDLTLIGGHGFPRPTSVLLTFADGTTVDLVQNGSLGATLPPVAGEYVLTYTIKAGDVGGPIKIRATGKTFTGDPINWLESVVEIKATAQTPATVPAISITGNGMAEDSGVSYWILPDSGNFNFQVTAKPAGSNSVVKILPTVNFLPFVTFFSDSAHTQIATSVESKPGQQVTLYAEVATTHFQDNRMFGTEFVAFDESTGVGTHRDLQTIIVGGGAGDAGPVLTVTPTPLATIGSKQPGALANASIVITSNVPTTTPLVVITIHTFEGIEFPFAIPAHASDNSGKNWIADVAVPASEFGVHAFTVVASDTTKASRPTSFVQSAFYVGTTGELIKANKQNDPAGGALSTLVPGQVAIVVNREGGLATIMRDSAGRLISEDASGLISEDASGLISEDASGLISEDASGLTYAIPPDIANGSSLLGKGAGSLRVSAAAMDLLAQGRGRTLALPDGTSLAIQGVGDAGRLNFSNGDVAGILAKGGGSILSKGAGNIFVPAELVKQADATSQLERATSVFFRPDTGVFGITDHFPFVGPQSATTTASAAPAAGVSTTPGGATIDALLAAQFLLEHNHILTNAGRPAADIEARISYINAALDIAATVADNGFTGLTATQLAALQRLSKVITLNVAPAIPGGAITPGSRIVLTPASAADSLALSTARAPLGGPLPVSLGGTVVTFGGVIQSANQPNAPVLPVPLYGNAMALVSAAPGTVEAVVPNLAAIGEPQLIVLTTADGHLAFGRVQVQAPTGTLQFSVPTYSWGAQGLEALVTVTRDGGASGVLGASVVTTDGSAKAGVDYNTVATSVIFSDGDATPKTIRIPLLNPAGSTADKTVDLSLALPFNNAAFGARKTAILTISPSLGTIRGQVFLDANKNGAKDSSELGVSGVSVYLDLNNNGAFDSGENSTLTDNQGRYALGGLAAGNDLVRIVVPNGDEATTVASRAVTVDGTGAVVDQQDFGVSNAPPPVPGTPAVPTLTAQSDTGLSSSDRLTKNNGSASAPLAFNVSEMPAQNDYYRLFDVTNPNAPVLITGPTQAASGTISVSGIALADGLHKIAATTAASATGTQSALSAATSITIQSSLKVTKVTPADKAFFASALPEGKVVVTFSHPLANFKADDPSGGGFSKNPFAVYLVPRGPGGVFAAPSGLDSGSTPLHATLVYHANANGTSTITLTPREPLATDVYLIAVSGTITDQAGNRVQNNAGTAGTYYTTFELRPIPSVPGAPKVTSVTTLHASVPINGKPIPQPDTIAIGFNKPLNFLTVTTTTVQLLAGPNKTPVAESVIYSPTTNTIYVTPQAALVPGITYTVRVVGTGNPSTSVTGDQGFPNPGFPLSTTYTTTFQVNAPTAGVGRGPLRVLTDSNGQPAFSPGAGVKTSPFGYASIAFSERLDLSSFGRYSAMLSLQAGGLNNTAFDAADAALNARLAFNPNTNTLILVPTVPLSAGSYLYTLSHIKAVNGDPLTNPGGALPIYQSFSVKLKTPTRTAAQAALDVDWGTSKSSSAEVPVPAVAAEARTPSTRPNHPQRFSLAARHHRPAQAMADSLISRRPHGH